MSGRAPVRAPVSDAALDALVESLRAEFPRFALRYKDESRLQRLIAALLRPFNDRYLSGYTTVMFGQVWLPSRAFAATLGNDALFRLLRHERVHLRDARRFPVLFEVSYLLPPLGPGPRAYWEWRAYEETLRCEVELYGRIDLPWLDDLVERFAGPDYLYMWPFRRWLRRRLEALRLRLLREAGVDPARDV